MLKKGIQYALSYDGLICKSCGARKVVKKDGLYTCQFCHSNVVPRLVPGARCSDMNKGAICSMPAETLCTACARPLCSIHNDPKIIYWQASLEWRKLCPEWDEEAGKAWHNLVNPHIRLPISGFEPFEWTSCDEQSLAVIGNIELEIADVIKGIVEQLGGGFYETGIHFNSICSFCHVDAEHEVLKTVAEFGPRYRKAAYSERIRAIEADLKQGVKYIEAFLERPIRKNVRSSPPLRLEKTSFERDWESFGADLKRRLVATNRLINLLK